MGEGFLWEGVGEWFTCAGNSTSIIEMKYFYEGVGLWAF